MSSFKKITITTVLIIIAITLFLVSGMDAIKGLMFLTAMFWGYAVLWVITIPCMIWSLLPSNRPKPLASAWKMIGLFLFVLGYPPAIFTLIFCLSRQRDWGAAGVATLMILGPIFVFSVFKIKKRFIIKNDNDTCDEKPNEE